MNFYHRLSLPSNPVVTSKMLDLYKLKTDYNTMITQVDEFIKPEVLEIFANLGHQPTFFVYFGTPDTDVNDSYIHTDVLNVNGKQVLIPFAINWELTPGHTVFHWWDTKSTQSLAPNLNDIDVFGGIHYDQYNNRDTTKFTLLEKVQLAGEPPVLVKTDIPHSVSYQTKTRRRIGISLRFDLDEIPTYERAVEIFSPLFI